MERAIDSKLIEAVEEYYMFQDGLNPAPVKWVYDKKNLPALLVRFDNATDNAPMSALMDCDH